MNKIYISADTGSWMEMKLKEGPVVNLFTYEEKSLVSSICEARKYCYNTILQCTKQNEIHTLVNHFPLPRTSTIAATLRHIYKSSVDTLVN
jgi:hypothetical protein